MNGGLRYRASLLLNVLLAAAAVVLAYRGSESAPVAAVLPAKAPVTPDLPHPAPSLPYLETASPAEQRRWLVDELRALRVPNSLLARIVLEALEKEWNARCAEVLWKSHGDGDAMNAIQLEKDMTIEAQMAAALGEASFKQWDQENVLRQAMTTKVDLTGAEADTIYDLKKKRQERDWELRLALQKGTIDQADIEDATAKANAELVEQMKSVLGNERYAKSQGVDPGTAAEGVRQDFAKANPTDAQFQALLQTQQQWNERQAALEQQIQAAPAQSGTFADQIKALAAARDEEYKRVLGAGVFDALQKEQDGGYAQMKKYETRWGLDDGKVDSIYGTLQYYQKSVQDYQNRVRALEAQGQTVDWVGVNKNLQQFKEQTQQLLRNDLGDDRYEKLLRGGVFHPFAESRESP